MQTAWQEGGDNDPVNQMAAMHLDLASWNFGIQEENHFRPEELDAFPGHAVLEGGYLYANDRPGLGIDIDEAKATALLNAELARRPTSAASRIGAPTARRCGPDKTGSPGSNGISHAKAQRRNENLASLHLCVR